MRGPLNQAAMDETNLMGLKCDDVKVVDGVEHEEESWMRYWDDVSGKELPGELVKAARAEELQVIKDMGVWEERPREECLKRTGRKPITLRWVDTNKGDCSKPNVRRRLVAREIKKDSKPELFAATPPLEYVRFLISQMAGTQLTEEPTQIMVVDVKKAYFFAPAKREVYIELPPELGGDGSKVGLLRKSLYGTRDAALNWADAYSDVLFSKLGFEKGTRSPCNFVHHSRRLKLVVHGDDFVIEGPVVELKLLKDQLAKHFEIKHEIVGYGPGEVRQLRILNRVVTLEATGITWEADPRHLEVLVETLKLDKAKGLKIPGVVEGEDEHIKKEQQCKKARSLDRELTASDDALLDEGDDAGGEVDGVLASKIPQTRCDLRKGDRVMVREHGCGTVMGVGCCGFKDRVEIKYDDDTRFHCKVDEVELQNRHRCDLLRCQGCSSWQLPGKVCGVCECDNVVGNVGVEASSELLLRDGWTPIGGGQWMVQLKGAKGFLTMPAGLVKRRTTRRLEDGKLVEDLWVKATTPERMLRRQFREPMDVEVRIETSVEHSSADDAWGAKELGAEESSLYRAVTARLNFLSLDRPDVMYSSKECSRRMSPPKNRDWEAVIRLVRYLIQNQRFVHNFEFQEMPSKMNTFCDSNWAGCRATRKSTSGCSMMVGKHLIKSFSKTQATIALSSAEGELYALVQAASESLGLQSMARDSGVHLEPWIWVDASAAIGIARRKGLGKVRHVETQSLWDQDSIREKRLVLNKVCGKDNPGDIFTKYLDFRTMEKHLRFMGIQRREGRPAVAPQVVRDHEADLLRGGDVQAVQGDHQDPPVRAGFRRLEVVEADEFDSDWEDERPVLEIAKAALKVRLLCETQSDCSTPSATFSVLT